MTIRDLVTRYLLDDLMVQNFLGSRLFPDMLPQKVTYPAGVIQAIDIVRPNTLRGVATLARARIQVDIYAQPDPNRGLGSRAMADETGTVVRMRLDGFSGVLVDTSASPERLVNAWITFDLETEGAEPELHGGLSRHTTDYLVEYATQGGAY